jgi:hypothetical protein
MVNETLKINSEAWYEKYLGLPVYIGRSKRNAFAYLKDNLEKNTRLDGEVVGNVREGGAY